VSYGEARGWLQRLDFALALVDLNLASSAAPEGNRDGFFLLRATRQRSVPAVVVSALGDPADIDRAYDEFGIFAFVEKEGFDRRNFLRLLEEALQAGRSAVLTSAAGEHSNPAFEALTPREREVMALLIQGHTNRQIAEALLITPNTTKKHVDHILQKLGVSTRAGAVAAALREA
jgi:DNA-binding NarL/FixJ family response regulator